MPSGDAPADPSPMVDKGKAKVDDPAVELWLEVNPVKVHGLGAIEAMAKVAWIVLARLGHQRKWRKLLVTSRVLLTKCSMISKSPTKSVMDCKNGWKRPKKEWKHYMPRLAC
ncbi:hypothetical protein R1flu_006315 [Riccia fluitans]|uniref:Uncharacterized protein n=1 Tax=Riccia fluitans TaxID=41844 RepID=A0ABD1YWB2_9MARC